MPELLPLAVAAARGVTPDKVVEALNGSRGLLGGDDEQRELMVTLDTFAAVRFGLKSSLWPLGQEDEMKHIYAQSPYGQQVRREAREEGRTEGHTEGRVEGRLEERLAMLKSMVEALGATWRPVYSEAGAKLTEALVADLLPRAVRETDRGALQRMLDDVLGGVARANDRGYSLKTG